MMTNENITMSESNVLDAQTVFIDTGNLNLADMLRRNLTKQTSEEAMIGLQCTVSKWINSPNQHQSKPCPDSVMIFPQLVGLRPSIHLQQSDQLNTSVKVFMFSQDDRVLEEAICTVLHTLGRSAVDSLVVAFPPIIGEPQAQRVSNELLALWKRVEQAAEKQLASDFGVSDLSLEELQLIVEHSQKIKPVTNHINLEYCCAISPELSAFAEKNGIRLVTHNDPKDFLCQESFEKLLKQMNLNANEWQRRWVARYTLMNKVKGIVNHRGYMLGLNKKN